MCFAKTTTYHSRFWADNNLFMETCCEIRQGIFKTCRVSSLSSLPCPQEIIDEIIDSRANSIVMIYVGMVRGLFERLYPDDGDIHAAQAYNIIKQTTAKWFFCGFNNNGKYPPISNKSPSGRQFPGGWAFCIDNEYHANYLPPLK